jgi:hypothetical protein
MTPAAARLMLAPAADAVPSPRPDTGPPTHYSEQFVSPLTTLAACAEVLARLVDGGKTRLDKAVSHLVLEIEDVLDVLDEAEVACDPWEHPGWAEAAREYRAERAGRRSDVKTEPKKLARLRRLMADDISVDRAWYELNDPRSRPTPQMTIEAIVYSVRERGLSALREPDNIERLSRCDAAAKEQIDGRIAKLIADGVISP